MRHLDLNAEIYQCWRIIMKILFFWTKCQNLSKLNSLIYFLHNVDKLILLFYISSYVPLKIFQLASILSYLNFTVMICDSLIRYLLILISASIVFLLWPLFLPILIVLAKCFTAQLYQKGLMLPSIFRQ